MAAWTVRGGGGVPYDISHIIAQASLARGWLWIPSIDGVSWTLEIEIVFYLIAAILSPFLLRSNYAGRLLLGYAIATPVLCLVLLSALDGVSGVAQTILLYATYALPFTVFMFIGTLFHLASSNRITPSQLVYGVIAASWGFLVGLAAHPALKSFSVSSYFIALGVFGFFWWARGSFRSNAVLDRMADISYPLYAVHAVLGYSIMYVLSGFFINPLMIIFCAVLIVIALSTVIHFAIERPTMLLGKRMAGKF